MVSKEAIDRLKIIISGLNLPSSINEIISNSIYMYYDKGVTNIETIINQNIIDTNPEYVSFLKNYSFDLIKNMNEEFKAKLQTTLERNLIEGKSYTNIVDDIKNIFDSTINRAKTIARTESYRAYNVGQLEAAKLSPIKLKKYYYAVIDNRTSPICRRLSKKYDREHAININQKFYDSVTGESWLTPPVHPNCRSRVIYIKQNQPI
jgi:SPP1 gp7 family putative phage head morphogenesis protein